MKRRKGYVCYLLIHWSEDKAFLSLKPVVAVSLFMLHELHQLQTVRALVSEYSFSIICPRVEVCMCVYVYIQSTNLP